VVGVTLVRSFVRVTERTRRSENGGAYFHFCQHETREALICFELVVVGCSLRYDNETWHLADHKTGGTIAA
jgi:hypothetical protein